MTSMFSITLTKCSDWIILTVLTLIPALAPAQASLPPATTPLQATQYAESAVADPSPDGAAAKRAAAMKFMESDHQTHVQLCSQVFQQMNANHAASAHEITLQYVVSAGAYLYQHPNASGDSIAQNVAGLNAAATVYETFLQANPKTRTKFLDTVAEQQTAGTLKAFVTRTCK